MEQGDRYNKGKLKWSLVSWKALEPMVRALMFGAEKYDDHNWKKGLKYTEICESLQRHLNAFIEGENDDPESKISHIGHILCNAMFLSYMFLFRKDLDDRFIDNNFKNEKSDVKNIIDLELYFEKQRPIVFNEEYEVKIPYDIFNVTIGYSRDKQNTYYRRGKLQCERNKSRSLHDLIIICKFYFPGITIGEIIKELLLFEKEKDVAHWFSYCPNIRKYNFQGFGFANSFKDKVKQVTLNEFGFKNIIKPKEITLYDLTKM